jgi:hypothetical protein
MQRLINRLTIALILVSCILIRPLTAHAQEDLDRPVPDKKFSNELLKNVLEELSRYGGFTFSYNSKLFNNKQLVTLTIKASTLREALTDILGDGYSYAMMDNYIIIRKNDIPAVKAKKAFKTERVEVKKEVKAAHVAAKRTTKMSKDVAVEAKGEIKVEKREMKESMPKAKMHIIDPVRDSLDIQEVKSIMRSIIEDIVRENIVGNKDSVISFALDNTQFIVNGQMMSDSLRTKFATRYIKPDGEGYYYGPVNVRGRGAFMSKEDLYLY